MSDEQVVVYFVNSEGNRQVVTDGGDAKCPACGYPERHRIYRGITAELIADGCPSCETSRLADVEIGSRDAVTE